jgi:tRNA modification GTPase
VPFSTSDTIVAIATPHGRGAIGIVRLSGPAAVSIAQQLITRADALSPRFATLTTIEAGGLCDQVVVTAFPRPASYTGEDVVEIGAHGSAVVLNAIVSAAVGAGARLAEPGEFTLRAYLNGKLDLPQAEAVADLIDAVTPMQARAAFDQLSGTLTAEIAAIDRQLFDLIARLEACVDFPDEGYHFIEPGSVADAVVSVIDRVDLLLASASRGRLIREGVQVAIVGPPNAGKSSLFNALVGAHRAIVTDIPGTTRDLVTEVVDFGGLRATLVDTAGIRESEHPVEREGIDRARGAIAVSDVVVVVCDGSSPWTREHDDLVDAAGSRGVVVASKSDLTPTWRRSDGIAISARSGDGMETLIVRIRALAGAGVDRDPPSVTNIRHVLLLEQAREHLEAAKMAVMSGGGSGSRIGEEFVLADLQSARHLLEEITGRRAPDDLLEHVFSRFCVGK